MRAVQIFRAFLDALNTQGGHIVFLFALMMMGVIAYRNGYPKADDIVLGAFTALLAGLRPGQQTAPPAPPPHP
jgi:hypothetical protein